MPPAPAPSPDPVDRLVGRSRALARVREQIRHLASSDAPVLIEGARGAGRAWIAHTLHLAGPRAAEPFVRVNCAARSSEEIERELFGRDARGDGRPRSGLLEAAEGGTVLLADADAAPAALQLKLLRLLHEHAFERAGGGPTLKADVRWLASALDLDRGVREGVVRADVAARLGAVRIVLPRLGERREDVVPLVGAMLADLARETGRVPDVSAGVLARLEAYEWPGDVRQLRAVVELMATGSPRGAFGVDDLPAFVRDAGAAAGPIELGPGVTLDEAERRLIAATLEHAGRDKRRAAALLGVALRTLYRKLEKYGIS